MTGAHDNHPRSCKVGCHLDTGFHTGFHDIFVDGGRFLCMYCRHALGDLGPCPRNCPVVNSGSIVNVQG